MKKIVSIILVVAMLLSLSSAVFAADNISTEEMRLNAFALELQESIPNSEVRVVDGVLHIVVDDPSDIPGFVVPSGDAEIMTSSVNSSQGGSFTDFDLPSHALTSYAPYLQVYMNADVANAALLELSSPSICDWIRDKAADGLVLSAIKSAVYAAYGLNVTTRTIGYIIDFGYYVAINMEYWSLESAIDSSATGKASVVYGVLYDESTGGVPSYIYSPWNNNICSTYGYYEAHWTNGVYYNIE